MIAVVVDRNLPVLLCRTVQECMVHHQSCNVVVISKMTMTRCATRRPRYLNSNCKLLIRREQSCHTVELPIYKPQSGASILGSECRRHKSCRELPEAEGIGLERRVFWGEVGDAQYAKLCPTDLQPNVCALRSIVSFLQTANRKQKTEIKTNSHHSYGIVVKNCRDIFGGELVCSVGYEKAGLSNSTVTNNDASVQERYQHSELVGVDLCELYSLDGCDDHSYGLFWLSVKKSIFETSVRGRLWWRVWASAKRVSSSCSNWGLVSDVFTSGAQHDVCSILVEEINRPTSVIRARIC